MLKKIILCLFVMSATALFADKTVTVTEKINISELKDKSIDNLKATLLKRAKLKAAGQLFGEVINSKTLIEDGKLIEDYIYAAEGGVLHIQGNPKFTNGEALGEQVLTLTVYATDKDLDDMTIKTIEIKDFIFANDDLGLKDLKPAAKDAFIVEAISKKRPSIKTASKKVELAKKFALSVNITKMDLDVTTASYKMAGTVKYIPAFVQDKKTNVTLKNSTKMEMIHNSAILSVESTSGKYKQFKINYNNGFILNKKVTKYLKRESIKNYVSASLNVRLLVPSDIESDTVNVSISQPTLSDYDNYGIHYEVSINGSKPSKELGREF